MPMNPKNMFLPFLATPLVALALVAATGCSGDPAVTASAADQPFSDDELAAMRKSVKTVGEFHELVRRKSMERSGSTVVKTKSVAGDGKPK
jgi:hypothetical protein